MRRDYKVFLTSISIVIFIIASGLLLFGTIDATQIDTLDCEKRFKQECPLKKEGQLPECCPNPRPPCQWGTGIRRIY